MSLRATAPSRATDLHQDALGKARRRGNTKRQDTWRKGLTAAKRKEHNAKCEARKRQRLTEMTAAQLQVYNAKRAAREKQRRKRKAQAAREAERKRKRDARDDETEEERSERQRRDRECKQNNRPRKRPANSTAPTSRMARAPTPSLTPHPTSPATASRYPTPVTGLKAAPPRRPMGTNSGAATNSTTLFGGLVANAAETNSAVWNVPIKAATFTFVGGAVAT